MFPQGGGVHGVPKVLGSGNLTSLPQGELVIEAFWCELIAF